jgi:hypothetical protein
MQQNLQVQGHLPVTFQITESFFSDKVFSFGPGGNSRFPAYLWSKIPVLSPESALF